MNQASKALLKILLDVKKLKLSEKDFTTQLKALSLKDDQIELLCNFVFSDKSLDDLLISNEYSFRDVEWRLETKISSRFLNSPPLEPKIVLKIHLDHEKSLSHRQILKEFRGEETKKELVVQTDANSLVHIIDQLETAKTSVNVRKAAAAISSS